MMNMIKIATVSALIAKKELSEIFKISRLLSFLLLSDI
jgi:hypothetical protein